MMWVLRKRTNCLLLAATRKDGGRGARPQVWVTARVTHHGRSEQLQGGCATTHPHPGYPSPCPLLPILAQPRPPIPPARTFCPPARPCAHLHHGSQVGSRTGQAAVIQWWSINMWNVATLPTPPPPSTWSRCMHGPGMVLPKCPTGCVCPTRCARRSVGAATRIAARSGNRTRALRANTESYLAHAGREL